MKPPSLFQRAFRTLSDRALRALGLAVIYRTGKAIGDLVCMTAVIRELNGRTGMRFVVVSARPEIFAGNPRVFRAVDFAALGPRARTLLIKVLDRLQGQRVLGFGVPLPEGRTFEAWMRESRSDLHLARLHASRFLPPTTFAEVRPELPLSEAETAACRARLPLPARYALIHSTGKASYTPNKEWGVERFQAVVDALREVTFVQIGAPDDPRLEGTLDLRGKTATLRELACVVKGADFVVCLEGLYNHLAAAYGVASYVVFSGFTRPELALYTTTVAIVRDPQVPCAPCWLTSPCPVPGKPCTSDVAPEVVVAAVRARLIC